jgi:HNH endonuclease
VGRRRTKCRPCSLKKFRLHALAIYPYCQWCQCPLTRTTATTDHLIPRSRGGSNAWHNLCLACRSCNQERKNNLPHKEPSGPRWGTGCPPCLPTTTNEAMWVAWTRYPGGRWRRTFRNASQERLRKLLDDIMGTLVERVILPDGQDPTTADQGNCTIHPSDAPGLRDGRADRLQGGHLPIPGTATG